MGNKKIITNVILGFITATALGWMAALIKVITLGDETWQGNVRVLFIPVAKVDNSVDGFSISSSVGLLVLGIFGGVIGYVIAKRSSSKHVK